MRRLISNSKYYFEFIPDAAVAVKGKIPERAPQRAYTVRASASQVMPVAQLTLEVRIEHAQSLKDRRQVVRSLKDQLRQGYNISVAEMDEAVTWQSATIGVVALSRSRDYLHGLVEEVERAARRILNEHGAELADSFWDYVES
jgi:uncharacterized protein YlxP (DUF503 family)